MTHAPGRSKRRPRGFSIVELLVAITIGAILLGGAVTLFVNNRQTYTISTDLARLQENARFALEMITSDVRMAGYVGCFNDLASVDNGTGGGAGQLWDPSFEIEGVNNATAPTTWLPSGFAVAGTEAAGAGTGGDTGVMVAGTDAITIRYLNGWLADNWDSSDGSNAADDIADLQVVGATTDTLTVNYYDATIMSDLGFTAGLIAGVSDCGVGDLFVVDSLPASGGDAVINVDGALSRTYSENKNPRVAPYYAVRYFIGNNDDSEPTLYRTVIENDGGLQERIEPLFEGVENMQILYGVDTRNSSGQPIPDGVPDVYVPANGAGAGADLSNAPSNTWGRVIAVRVALLLRTPQFGQSGEAAADVQPYPLLDVTVPAQNDRRRRRVFNATALARNLQPTN